MKSRAAVAFAAGQPLQIVDMGDVANVVEEIVLFVPKNRERRASLQ